MSVQTGPRAAPRRNSVVVSRCWFRVWAPRGAPSSGRQLPGRLKAESFLTYAVVLHLSPSSMLGLPRSFWAGVQRAAHVLLSQVVSPQPCFPWGPGAGNPRNPFGRPACPTWCCDPTKMSFALTCSQSFSNVRVTTSHGPAPPTADARAGPGFTNPSAVTSNAVNSDGRKTAGNHTPDCLPDLR